MRLAPLLVPFALAAPACDRATEVDHPFYLSYIEDSRETALFRCPSGRDQGCAIDGLPGPRVVAAGANKGYVVVAQRPDSEWSGPIRYYYFARVPEETRGWGSNPERIIGPLNEAQFEEAKARLRLPDFTVRP